MNRTEWKLQYGQQRKAAREARKLNPQYLTSSTVVRALKNLYCYEYLPEQEVFMHLMRRYGKKLPKAVRVTKKLLIRSWKPAARARGKDYLNHLLYGNNPFLALVGNDKYQGSYGSQDLTRPS